jgi:hypothetical protein
MTGLSATASEVGTVIVGAWQPSWSEKGICFRVHGTTLIVDLFGGVANGNDMKPIDLSILRNTPRLNG